MLNKSKGNMYPWVTHTWNPIRGKCPHDCSYCYMKRYPQPALLIEPKELRTNLGAKNFIFIGSSCDMWATNVPTMWINDVIEHCSHFDNRYLFQSKNPGRFLDTPFFNEQFRLLDVLLGTTIESNYNLLATCHAPNVFERYQAMSAIHCKKMVSIEPIMDFDLAMMVTWIKDIHPDFVSIGADSGNNHLPEPSWGKVQSLIKELNQITEVRQKDNLKRLNQEGSPAVPPPTEAIKP